MGRGSRWLSVSPEATADRVQPILPRQERTKEGGSPLACDSLQTSTRHEATDSLGKHSQMTTGPYRQHALEVVRRKGESGKVGWTRCEGAGARCGCSAIGQRQGVIPLRGRGSDRPRAISNLAAIPYRLHEESQSRSQPQAHTDSTILPPQVNVVTLSSSNSSSTSSTRRALNALSQSSVQFGASS